MFSHVGINLKPGNKTVLPPVGYTKPFDLHIFEIEVQLLST